MRRPATCRGGNPPTDFGALARAAAETVLGYDWPLPARRYVDLYAEAAGRFAARRINSSVEDRRRRPRDGRANT